MELLPEVQQALHSKQPVVALESTIVAHGFPFPDNLKLARDMEAAVRGNGAVPATIAVIGGAVRVGLGPGELERVADPKSKLTKCNVADLSVAVAKGDSGATTVSATAHVAHQAGIEFFATGGIGGVHRGDTGDVSADLRALASLPVVVVSSGVKAILDVARTVEALETLGVLVLGYGCREFPSFYSRDSGIFLEHTVSDAESVIRIVRAHRRLGNRGGILVANPVPESVAIPTAEIAHLIDSALREADDSGLSGKAITPFLLAKVASASGGRTQESNRELALANASLAAQLAATAARQTKI